MDQGGQHSIGGTEQARRPGREPAGRGRWSNWPVAGLILTALSGCLLGRATLLGRPGLLAIAWVAALRCAGSPGAWWAAGGALVGLAVGLPVAPPAGGWWVSAGAGPVWGLLRGAAALTLVCIFVRPRGGAGNLSGMGVAAAVAAGAGAVAVGVLPPDGGGHTWFQWLSAALLGSATGLLCLIFARGLHQARRLPPIRLWESEAVLAGLLLALGIIGGLQGVRVGAAHLTAVATGAAVLAAGWAGGPLAGAAAGLLAGVGGMLTGPRGLAVPEAYAVEAVSYGVGGLLAGAFRDLGRGGVVVPYALAYWLLSFVQFRSTPAAVTGAVWQAVLAAAVFLGVPARWLHGARQWLLGGQPAWPAGTGPAEPEHAGEAGTGKQPESRLVAMAHALRDIQRTLVRPPAAEPAGPAAAPDAAAPVIGEVQERVCHGCSLYKRCWEQDFYRTYHLFAGIWKQMAENGPIPPPLVPDALQRHCSYPLEVMAAFNAVRDLWEARSLVGAELDRARRQLGEHLKTVAGMLEDLAAETASARTGVRAPAVPRYQLRVGVARMSKRGSLVSGDSYIADYLAPDRYLLALSDGTGAGRDAALESQQVLRLLKNLLRSGYRLETAVQVVNSALTLRDAGDRFPTLDVMLLDLVSGEAQMVKVGAAPTALKRGPHMQIIYGEAPPFGVLHPLPVEPESRVLRARDWIVMATDGLWDRERGGPPGRRWLEECLAAAGTAAPEGLAEAILARALAEGDEEPVDDITVLVARVEPAGRSGEQTPPVRSGEPVPARRVPPSAARKGSSS